MRDNTVIFVRLVNLQTDTEFYTALLKVYLFLDLFLILIFSLLNKRDLSFPAPVSDYIKDTVIISY